GQSLHDRISRARISRSVHRLCGAARRRCGAPGLSARLGGAVARDRGAAGAGAGLMPRISGAQRGEGVQAVVFALQILEYLAQHRSTVGVTDLARVFDTTKSRMHRHLQTLVAAGYVMRDDETERYRSGARLIAFGRAVSENFELSSAARPVMEMLRGSLGHAVALSQPDPDGMRVIGTIAGKSAFELG